MATMLESNQAEAMLKRTMFKPRRLSPGPRSSQPPKDSPSSGVENPWIAEINAQQTLESVRGKPARNAEVVSKHRKAIPTDDNQASSVLDQSQVAEDNRDLPGYDAERTRRIFAREHAAFDQPKLKSTRDLTRFDVWEEGKTAQDWIEFYEGKKGPHAQSPSFESGMYVWEAVELLDYDHEKARFKVRVLSTGLVKKVNRLSIKFNDEDPELFKQRLSQGRKLQKDYEGELRFLNYIDAVPTEKVSQLASQTKNHILDLALATLRNFPFDRYRSFAQDIMTVVEEEYVRAMKQTIIQRKMMDPSNDLEFASLNLRVRRKAKHFPYYGTIHIEYPEDSFMQYRHKVDAAHWYRLSSVVYVNKILAAKCYHFMEYRYLQTDQLKRPMELSTLYKAQSTHHAAMRQQISIHWREYLISETQDKMSHEHNFFAVDQDEYRQSALHRVLRRLDLFMNSYMSEFVRLSITDWLNFLLHFAMPEPGEHWSKFDKPLITLHLYADLPVKKTGRKDTKSASCDVVLKPSLSKACKFLTGCFDWISDAANSVNNLECDLVPFMKIQKSPSFHVTPDNPWVVSAKAALVGALEAYSQGPKALLEEYKQFEWLVKLDSHHYIKTLFEKRLSPAKLNSELHRFSKAEYDVLNTSNDFVDFDLFQIKCADLKELVSKRAEKIRSKLLEKIAVQVQQDIDDILAEYKNICDKLKSLPLNEEELFDIKNFSRNIRRSKEELAQREADVYDHMVVLDEFQFKVNENVLVNYFYCKTWPLEVDTVHRDSEAILEEEEEKFKSRLDREKDKWARELEQLKVDFELVQQFADYNNTAAHYDDVKRLEEQLNDHMKTLRNFNHREGLFELPLSDVSELQRIIDSFMPFNKLWSNVNSFRDNFNKWMNEKKVKELKANEIQTLVDTWYRECFMLTKKLNDKSPEALSVIAKLKEQIEAFQLQLPIIKALSNEAMKDTHWLQITKLAKLEDDPLVSTVETVQSVTDKGLQKYIEEIEDISYRAQREYKLEKKLIEMTGYWDDITLEIIPLKDTFILRTIEELQNMLDEQIVQTQAMKTSPFVGPIEPKCREWEHRLLNLQETLSEWIKCQRVYMNLEPIFTSEDIAHQMPMESGKFALVNDFWKRLMEASVKEPLLNDCIPDNTLLQSFKDNNTKLDQIQKQLNQYLEMKRILFPRFFFLSDEDLVKILSQTKDPLMVQEHLNKCFEAIDLVEFTPELKIVAMLSPEKERVEFIKSIDVNEGEKKGNVEVWMKELEKTMFDTVKDFTKRSLLDLQRTPRTEWVKNWPAMGILCVNMITWTAGVENAIHKNNLAEYEAYLNKQLLEVVNLVRGKLPSLVRKTLNPLVTIDVHARDIVADLKKKRVRNLNEFDWLSQLRYYWEQDGSCTIRIVNAMQKYGFEYLGNSPRLVITPLTDRCYRTLIGAYHLFYGGAPEGPAGTGKTESTKDLAKAVAMKCVVFNCSDNLNNKAMAKFFKGLAASGSWCCFDEFNRIVPDVLSVIAMQVLAIQGAVRDRKKVLIFEGTEIFIVSSCAINITMNPGYAGRAELPDNLKALFRPCAMMVPDYALISEISLYSYGFEHARNLAMKIVASLKLSSELLSSQSHYDFGMRAVKSILTAAGNLKMKYKDDPEDILTLRALCDVNVPKFTSNDIPLFLGIINDLFPGTVLPQIDYGVLLRALEDACAIKNLQPKQEFKDKCIQLWETILVRHGLMLVGQTFSGKTRIIETLQLAISCIPGSTEFVKTLRETINPKSIEQHQLYGRFNPDSQEWYDGVLALLIRKFVSLKGPERKWLVFDGPVDAVWIENMNTVLDDNKMLCLSNGEIIRLTDGMTMMFEVEDLKVASPATVSRCGMVFLEPSQLGWGVLVKSYVAQLPYFILDRHGVQIEQLFEWFLHTAVEFGKRRCKHPVPVTEMEFVRTVLNIFDSYMGEYRQLISEEEGDSPDKLNPAPEQSLPKDFDEQLKNFVLFSVVWGIGGSVDEESRPKYAEFIDKLIEGVDVRAEYVLLDTPDTWEPINQDYRFPPNLGGLFEMCFEKRKDSYTWQQWMQLLPSVYIPHKDLSFNEIIVPTKDSVRVSYLFNFLAREGQHVLFSGFTGTGKTIAILSELRQKYNSEKHCFLFMAFSAQTGANKTQHIMEEVLKPKRRNTFAPPDNRKMVIFVDDLNMPSKEEYGAQPPIELLRQWMDYGGWYDLETKEFRWSQNLQFVAAMGPPSGGRNQITQRYLRHYNKFYVVPFEEDSLNRIFGTIVDWWLSKEPFARPVVQLRDSLVSGTIQIFQRISKELLPTPAKSHYTYNLRDVSKVFQGITQAVPVAVKDEGSMIRLWAHECMRVFQDRLVNPKDRQVFDQMLRDTMRTVFRRNWEDTVKVTPLLFGSFVPMELEEGRAATVDVYCELSDHKKLHEKIAECLEYYNQTQHLKMNLVMFMAAVEHVVKIVRIIQQPFGNALLVGVGGSGRKSLTQLATSISEFSLFQIELVRGYGMAEWREDLKRVFMQAGLDNKPTVFLLNDTQIVNEGFLEDVNNLLNNGEVPNLLEAEDKQAILDGLKEVGRGKSGEAIYAMFVDRVRANLHLSICMSPIGDSFRKRLRMYNSLVSCTTIDWFLPWPEEALRSVAKIFLEDIDTTEEIKQGLVDTCVDMQERVTDLAEKYREELRRHYYVTPTSYIELIIAFKQLLSSKSGETKRSIRRYEEGLEKIIETQSKVTTLQKEQETRLPLLLQAQKETQELKVTLLHQQAEAEKQQINCEKDKAACKVQSDSANAVKEECDQELRRAEPIKVEAEAALAKLKPDDIVEVKGMSKPPKGVVVTMEVLVCLLNVTPIMVPNANGKGKSPDYWETAKKTFLTDTRLLTRLKRYVDDELSPEIIARATPLVQQPDFHPDRIKTASVAAFGICKWARAVVNYDAVMRVIKPKQEALAIAIQQVREAEADLAIKTESLEVVLERLARLNAEYQTAVDKEQELKEEYETCELRLTRSKKLIDGLKDEKVRWAETAKNLRQQSGKLTGDIMVSAGIIAYLGVFTSHYRKGCVDAWLSLLEAKQIVCSPDYSLQKVLGNPVKIRDWTLNALPNDSLSIDNAIIMEQSKRWPLMIDPQIQANNWIKKMEGDNLKAIRLTQSDFERTLATAISIGKPVLIENVGEMFDPILDSLLASKKGSSEMLKLGDRMLDFSPEFKLYITTKLPRPHYAPEICVKLTMLNFTTTEEGLMDQMLALTVEKEAPAIEQQRLKCLADSARFKKELKETEDRILEMLRLAEGEILDNQELIDTLSISKQQSRSIQEQLEAQKHTEERIENTRKEYKPVAYRVSLLFFCVMDMSLVEPMYQYSLEWYTKIFKATFEEVERGPIQERVRNLVTKFSLLLYQSTCRSLFEKDKLLFSFLMAIKVLTGAGRIDQAELRFLMTGGTTTTMPIPNPTTHQGNWLEDKEWAALCELANFPNFKHFDQEFTANVKAWQQVWNSKDPDKTPWPGTITQSLDKFQRLIVLRILRPDVLVASVEHLISEEVGPEFISPPPFDLELSYKDSDMSTPIIFVLSPGVDPISEIRKLAQKKGFHNKMEPMALGDGQGEKAEKTIDRAVDLGTWVILQNCHLAEKWMPTLERKVEEINPATSNPDFRLWLTSAPSEKFPVSVLQNGIKLTNEPPKGLKQNVLRSYLSYDPAEFEDCSKPREWKRLLYGLSFFHAVILERRKFGGLGWNIPYEFSSSDLSISVSQLRMFLNEYEDIPWAALNYLAAEANYGGRVTDVWDRRTIITLLSDFYVGDILSPTHKFTENGVYRVPPEGSLQDYVSYIKDTLPRTDITELFGLHENASISSAINDTDQLLSSCLGLLPRTTGSVEKTQDQILTEKAIQVYEMIPKPFDIEAAMKAYPVSYTESMNTVLIQELIRFNRLIVVIRSSAVQVKDAIAGLVIMSAELEEVANAFMDNRIPKLWADVSYPSLKPLAFWLVDLLERLKFMQTWLDNRAPKCYWISGFFFTQSFLTGTMQNYARKTKIPIDTLCYDFEVMSEEIKPEQITEGPEDGAYIYGLFLDGARWDDNIRCLAESQPKVLYCPVPMIWLKPMKIAEVPNKHVYEAPVYKTSKRAGTLSTTGHSTNFVLSVNLTMQPKHTVKHWVKRGVALLTQLNF
jgi:dynein heavy chain